MCKRAFLFHDKVLAVNLVETIPRAVTLFTVKSALVGVCSPSVGEHLLASRLSMCSLMVGKMGSAPSFGALLQPATPTSCPHAQITLQRRGEITMREGVRALQTSLSSSYRTASGLGVWAPATGRYEFRAHLGDPRAVFTASPRGLLAWSALGPVHEFVH